MYKKERNHILKIFYDMAKLIKEFIGIIVAVGVLVNKIGIVRSVLIGVVLAAAVILYEFLLWRKNFFAVGENFIYHQEGVFNVKKWKFPLRELIP